MLIVPTTDGEAIEQFSLRVAEAWKIGRKKIDDGALLVIAKNDRHLRIEVGYGLEGALTDATTKRIIDEDITPKFKAGDFAGGISAGVDRMIRVIDGEKLPAPEPPHWRITGSFDPIDLLNPFLIIPVLLFGGVMRRTAGPACRLGGGRRPGDAGRLVSRRLAGGCVDRGVIALRLRDVQRCITTPTPGRGVAEWRLVGRQQRRLLVAGAAVARATAAASAAVAAVLAAAARRGAGSMGIKRIGKHLLSTAGGCGGSFRQRCWRAIEAAIKAGEATHSGQVRFVVEGALDGAPLFRNQPARERALDVFSQLRIWDTAHNNGVLIYLLLADRDVEIVADRGIDAKVGARRLGENLPARWKRISGQADFERGVIKGIEAVSRELATHFPKVGGGTNELPDAPVVI